MIRSWLTGVWWGRIRIFVHGLIFSWVFFLGPDCSVWKNKQQVPFCNALAVNLVSFDILSVNAQVGGFGARVWGSAAIVGLFGLI
jgi:nitrate reductase NapE component